MDDAALSSRQEHPTDRRSLLIRFAPRVGTGRRSFRFRKPQRAGAAAVFCVKLRHREENSRQHHGLPMGSQGLRNLSFQKVVSGTHTRNFPTRQRLSVHEHRWSPQPTAHWIAARGLANGIERNCLHDRSWSHGACHAAMAAQQTANLLSAHDERQRCRPGVGFRRWR